MSKRLTLESTAVEFIYYLNGANKKEVLEARDAVQELSTDLSRSQEYRTTCKMVLPCLNKQLRRF